MIYLDNAATTRPCPTCVTAVGSMLTDHFANPSSLHGPGIDAMKEIIAARSALADALGVERDTLTSPPAARRPTTWLCLVQPMPTGGGASAL